MRSSVSSQTMASGTLANSPSRRAVSMSRGTSVLPRVSPTAEIVVAPITIHFRRPNLLAVPNLSSFPTPNLRLLVTQNYASGANRAVPADLAQNVRSNWESALYKIEGSKGCGHHDIEGFPEPLIE